MGKHVVATVAEIPPGRRKIVEVAGRSIGVFNVNGEFLAIRNRCPHESGPLCEGRLVGFLVSDRPGEYRHSRPGEILRCPWHGWEFDLRTGQSWFDPRRVRVRRYDVAVAPGAALVGGAGPSDGQAGAPGNAADVRADAEAEGMARGPHVAETYAVSVEEEYVLVEVPG
jgi:nitrite reductase/ring-hydroxylating ferredoxin subunit